MSRNAIFLIVDFHLQIRKFEMVQEKAVVVRFSFSSFDQFISFWLVYFHPGQPELAILIVFITGCAQALSFCFMIHKGSLLIA